jgi:hypothetical protein
MTRSTLLRGCALSTAVAMACAVPTAHAVRMELSGGIGAEYTTNVLRSEDNEQDEMIGVTWGGLSVREDAANLSAEVAGVVESRQYINDVASDDLLFSLASIVDWMILPQRLNWHFEDYFQQSRVNPLEIYSPDNRQDTNVLWTGPDLHLRFAQLYTVQLSGRYGNFYYEESNGDNQRLAGIVRANRRLTPTSDLFVQASRTRTEYDNAGDPGDIGADPTDPAVPILRDFDRSDAFAGFRWESVLTELQLEGGYSRITREDPEEEVDGPLWRVSVRRRLPAEGAVGLRASTQLSEGGDASLASQGGRLDVDPTGVDVTHDVARSSDVELFYYSRLFGGGIDLRTFWGDDDYEDAELDRREAGIAAHYSYPLSPLWTLSAFGGYRETDYRNIDRQDQRVLVGVGAAHRLSRRISVDFELRDEWQDSNVNERDFNEIVALIELRYGERPSGSTR